MSNSIKLSRKHGLNPTIPICFWCGQEKNEIAILGKVDTPDEKDVEAPMYSILDYTPCEKCQTNWDTCVICIAATETPNTENQLGIKVKNEDGSDRIVYPTGEHIGITPEAARNGLGIKDAEAGGQPIIMDSRVFAQLFGDIIAEEKAKQQTGQISGERTDLQ